MLDEELSRLERAHAEDPQDKERALRYKAALLRAGGRAALRARYRQAFDCGRRWGEMEAVDATTRRCAECRREVRLAGTCEDVARLGAEGRCAAVWPNRLDPVLDGMMDAPGRGLAREPEEPCLVAAHWWAVSRLTNNFARPGPYVTVVFEGPLRAQALRAAFTAIEAGEREAQVQTVAQHDGSVLLYRWKPAAARKGKFQLDVLFCAYQGPVDDLAGRRLTLGPADVVACVTPRDVPTDEDRAAISECEGLAGERCPEALWMFLRDRARPLVHPEPDPRTNPSGEPTFEANLETGELVGEALAFIRDQAWDEFTRVANGGKSPGPGRVHPRLV